MTMALEQCLRTLAFLAPITDTSVVGKVSTALNELEAAFPGLNERAGALVAVRQHASTSPASQNQTPFQRFLVALVEERLSRLSQSQP